MYWRKVFSGLAVVEGLSFLTSAAGQTTRVSTNMCGKGSPAVLTTNGTVCGTHLPTFLQDAFLGVPFAEPPVRDLRLRHPVSYNTTYTAYNATSQPPSCPGYGGFDVGIGPMNEDCLYLNIVAPSGASRATRKLPVLVWIYGGGFDAGGVADPRFNMSYIVQESSAIGRPILGVSINYRVGGWGFLASKEVLESGSANIGLFDQRLALRWLRENVAGFGGDPDQITIWGESAGAFSVVYHLIGFDGQHDNMFRAAIMESGTMLGPAIQDSHTMSLEGGYQKLYDNVTKEVGCDTAKDTLDCLRTVPYTESLAQGMVADVAVLLGANTDEGTATFWGPRGSLQTTTDVADFVQSLNGGGLARNEVDELLLLYPDVPSLGCPYGTGRERFADQGWMYKRGASIAGDIFVHAGRRGTASFFAQRKRNKRNLVYSYRFDQPPWNGKEELIATVPPVYSTHFSELIFVFHNPSHDLSNYIGPYSSYHQLSKLMCRSWISFVHDLDPNHHHIPGAPFWPVYDSENPINIVYRASDNNGGTYLELDTYREAQLDWWNEHWPTLRS
ncbi:hypothetical protein V502_03705 [Pseudogymnoascus sp. VKM F-4520 (FW-2644)]|nr:hypothetical protein V502_03705 [Pseudogymnoascus sp. VKM F-4520 (FW-2644)]